MQPNTRIAVNTVVIYIRLLITIFVSLFSTRYVLLALGETNFGIYNLIAGVVALFSFISATMAGTTQRYISYNMGQGDMQQVQKVLYNSRIIHFIIAIIVAVLIETAGLYLVNNILTIPIEKLPDARFVLHCVTIGLVFTILTVPYEAVLMAHENILFVSLVTIFNSFVKLGGAIILLYIAINKLRLYAVIMAILPIICLILQYIYCKKNYNETRPSSPKHLSVMDFSLIKEMSGYAGWVMIGVTCGTVRTQGTAMLLNLFFGVIANAANGIAAQVNGLMQQFSTSITTSIRPQLVKSAGEGNQLRMIILTFAACKYPSLLLGLFAIPLVVAMQYVLEIWLKEVPDNTVVFCRLMILSTIFNQLTMGLTTAIEATGKVKLLHMIIGSMHIISIPVAYVLFKIGYPPQTIFWCIVVEEFIAAIFRLVLAKKMINIGIRRYIKDVLIRVLFVMVLTGVACFTIWNKLNINIYNLILMCIISVIIYALLVFIYGFNVQERNTLLNTIQIGIKKIKLL